MTGRTVLTAIGEDRPGLVDEVSEFVFARGGNVEDSRMANLHGQFAIVMLISGGQDAIDRIAADLDALSEATSISARLTGRGRGDRCAAAPVPADRPRARPAGARASGRPRTARARGEHREHGDDARGSTGARAAPVFAMDLVVAVPSDTPVQKVRDELARVCDALNIDWSWRRRETAW